MVEGATYSFLWSDGSDLEYIDVTSGGTYSVTVTVTYENLSETGMAFATVSFLLPDVGGSDDDDVILPPQIVYEDSGSDSDDTTTVVACAAAAVVAAMLAVFLMIEYRKR